jgi:NADPH2:quinone reductase
MKAAYIEQPGPTANIRFGELPLPALHDHMALVRVDAVAVNHVDTYIRSGAYPIEMPMPFIIGRDMVGTVEAVGANVRNFRVGDVVWSNCLGIDGLQGTFAGFVAAPEERLYHLPQGVETQEAVAVAHSALTAVIGLFSKARLTAGDTLFINGGSGSVGLAVLQLAKAAGARVGVTAGSEEKAQWCRKMGADRVVNYRREDVGRAIRDFAPAGLDIYWEATPSLDPERVVPLMAQQGRLVVIAGNERPASFPVKPFYLRNCSLHGFTVTGTNVYDLQVYARQINAWLTRKVLKAKIAEVMPLSEAAQAHRKEEEGGLFGKIVLLPGN